jgi:hypothetical protein
MLIPIFAEVAVSVCRSALLVLVLLLASAGLAAPASATAPQQRMGVVAADYPPMAGLAELRDVACTDRTHCWAVGDARIGGNYRTLFERWTGSRWRVVPSPTPRNSWLRTTSVSCSSSSSCLAVGFYELKPLSKRRFNGLVERWNGVRWRLLPAPRFGPPASHQFTAVSCPAPKFCVATGETYTNNAKQRPRYGVTATWNGTAWHEVYHDRGGTMNGVSCASMHSCEVIFRPGKGNRLHRLQLAGGRWTTHVDNLVGVQSAVNLEDLDCFSATSCTAVGFNFQLKEENAAAAYHWNGQVWRTLHPGARMRLHSRELDGVSCPTSNECIAVGLTDRASANFGPDQGIPLVETFHDGRTSVVPATTAAHSASTALDAVTCLADGLCRGVGVHYRGNSLVSRTFADEGVLF